MKEEWQIKKVETTMFPRDWTEEKIKAEIKGAWESADFKSEINSKGNEWSGTAPSGIKIEGYINSDKVTAYPKYRGDK